MVYCTRTAERASEFRLSSDPRPATASASADTVRDIAVQRGAAGRAGHRPTQRQRRSGVVSGECTRRHLTIRHVAKIDPWVRCGAWYWLLGQGSGRWAGRVHHVHAVTELRAVCSTKQSLLPPCRERACLLVFVPRSDHPAPRTGRSDHPAPRTGRAYERPRVPSSPGLRIKLLRAP